MVIWPSRVHLASAMIFSHQAHSTATSTATATATGTLLTDTQCRPCLGCSLPPRAAMVTLGYGWILTAVAAPPSVPVDPAPPQSAKQRPATGCRPLDIPGPQVHPQAAPRSPDGSIGEPQPCPPVAYASYCQLLPAAKQRAVMACRLAGWASHLGLPRTLQAVPTGWQRLSASEAPTGLA